MAIKATKKLKIRASVAKFIARGLASTHHPLLAHIVPMRRCNLACAYCNEYDAVSDPVPTEVMFERIDRLGSFKTGIVTISGGERRTPTGRLLAASRLRAKSSSPGREDRICPTSRLFAGE